MDLTGQTPDDWHSTEHPRVYYGPQSLPFRRGEYAYAKFVADCFDEWNVVITIGPYRRHDLSCQIYSENQVIHLDFHSPGLTVYGPEIPFRPEHPVKAHGSEMVEEIDQAIDDV